MSEPRDAVLFDIDGTLIDSTYHHALAWLRAFARHDVHLPLWRLHRTIGMGGDKLVAEVSDDEVERRIGDALREAWEEEYAELEAEVNALPGAAELVRECDQRGLRVALASSGKDRFAQHAVTLLGVADQVTELTTTDDAEESKPDPELLQVTVDRLRATRAVLIGDTPYDVEAARRAGLDCLAVRSGGFGVDELREAGAALVVEEPRDLLGLDWEPYLREV